MGTKRANRRQPKHKTHKNKYGSTNDNNTDSYIMFHNTTNKKHIQK